MVRPTHRGQARRRAFNGPRPSAPARRRGGLLGAGARHLGRPVGHRDSRRAAQRDDECRRPVTREGRDWYRISNQHSDDGDVAVVDIYDEIGYWGTTAADFIAELRLIDADRIDLHINSPGGDVYDGLAVYNALIDHKATVTATVDGLAASAASFIAQAGDRVTMARGAEMMIHDAWGLCVGNADDMRDMAERLDAASDNIASIYAARAGNGGVKSWRSRMAAESWYAAQEAVDVGLADEVLPTRRRDAAAPEDRWDLSVFAYAGRSKAPAPDLGDRADARPAAGQRTGDATEPTDETDSAGSASGASTDENRPDTPDATDDGREEDGAVAGRLDLPDDLDFELDTKALHLALLDAADSAQLGVDTTPLREALEDDFAYDPDALRAVLLDTANSATAPPPAPDPPAPRFIDIDEFINGTTEALSS